MQNHNLVKNLFYFAILTTVVIAAWIIITVILSLSKSTIPEDTNAYSAPIEPTFDSETLNELGKRVAVPVDLSLSPDYLALPDSGSGEATPEAELNNSSLDINEDVEEEITPIEPELELTGTPASPTTIPVSENSL